MNKKLLLASSILCFGILTAQNNKQTTSNGFDKEKAFKEAKARGLAPADYAGYVAHMERHWMEEQGLVKKQSATVATKKHYSTTSSGANIGFESGDYADWLALAGENLVNSFGPLSNIRFMTPGGTDSLPTVVCTGMDTNRQGLMTNLYNDPLAGFTLASPLGGNYVARINRYCYNYEASVIMQNFLVTANQNILNYAYAVVLEDGGHLQGEQTYFMIRVLDQNGARIDSVYMQAANGVTPGFYQCLGGNTTATYYKPWTPVSVDLTAYIGQNVSVEVTASACIYGGHSGYGYFDARLDSTSSTPNVWPGDANYDLVADMNDLLYLGWAYGANGTPRAGATNNWQAEPSTNWGQSTIYGTEFKNADCNGDGTIDLNDTLAINLNYGQQHAFRLSHPDQVSAPLSMYRNMSITPNVSTIGPNQALTLSIDLPVNSFSTNDLYGIAFRLNVPSQYIGSMSSADFANSIIGVVGSDMMTVAKAFVSQGHIDFCLVKRDQLDCKSGGKVLDVNLLAGNFATGGTGYFSISSIKALTYSGASLPIGASEGSVNFSTTTSIQKTNSTEIKLMPNPASDKITFEGLTDSKITIEVVNVIGQSVLKTNLEGRKSIDVSSFEKGAYFVKLNTQQGVIIKKFIKE